MSHDQINNDLATLASQLVTLKVDMDNAIRGGRDFMEVKMIHLQIKELSRLIESLKEKSHHSTSHQN